MNFNFIPRELFDTPSSHWDGWWSTMLTHYSNNNELEAHLAPPEEFSLNPSFSRKSILALDREEFYGNPLILSATKAYVPTLCWMHPKDVVNKRVIEFGSGLCVVGKRLSPLVRSYVGVDVSRLATSICKSFESPKFRVRSISDKFILSQYRNCFDSAFMRETVIHINAVDLRALFCLVRYTLRNNASFWFDIYLPDEQQEKNMLNPYDYESTSQANSVFNYKIAEIEAILAAANLRMVDSHALPSLQRNFITAKAC